METFAVFHDFHYVSSGHRFLLRELFCGERHGVVEYAHAHYPPAWIFDPVNQLRLSSTDLPPKSVLLYLPSLVFILVTGLTPFPSSSLVPQSFVSHVTWSRGQWVMSPAENGELR